MNGDKIVTNFNQYMVTNTRVLTPTMVNESRFGLTQFYNTTGPELAFTRDVVGELNIPGLASGPPVQWGIPNMTLADGYSGFGNGSEGPYENNNSSLAVYRQLELDSRQAHVQIRRRDPARSYNQVGNQFARGQFSFNATPPSTLA